MRVLGLVLGFTLAFAGCNTGYRWVSDASPAQFQRDEYECRRDQAFAQGGPVTPGGVLGSQLAATQSNLLQAYSSLRLYEQCMIARGYRQQ